MSLRGTSEGEKERGDRRYHIYSPSPNSRHSIHSANPESPLTASTTSGSMERDAMVVSSARPENCPEALEGLENVVLELEGEKRRLEKRLQETKEVLVCRVCLDRPVAAVFMPCAHLSTCVTCSASLTTCPLCRSPIHYAAPVIL